MQAIPAENRLEFEVEDSRLIRLAMVFVLVIMPLLSVGLLVLAIFLLSNELSY